MEDKLISAMLQELSTKTQAATTILGLFLLCLGFFLAVRSYLYLSHINGPFWASISNLQRVSWVLSGRSHRKHISLHEQYGDVVRFGPNMVSVGDPSAIPTIYPMRPGVVKSPFYSVLIPYTKGQSKPALFTASDEEVVKMLKTPIAPVYSQSNIVTFEKYVDQAIELFFGQLQRRFIDTNKPCKFGDWVQMFAFDAMGLIAFSRPYGFLERGEDVDGVMGNIWKHFKTSAPYTQMPWIDALIKSNPVVAYFWPPTSSPMLKFGAAKIQERQAAEKSWEEASELNNRDFLSRFVEAQVKTGAPPWTVTVWTFSIVTAGSDSTAVVLRTIFYHLFRHRITLDRLRQELGDLSEKSMSSNPCKWTEVRDLPYLDACVKEGMRLHPPFSLPLERVVPEGGLVICGKPLRAGTIVGMSPWVVNYHKPTFGEDVLHWRPERWLCDEPGRKVMEQALMTFGAGRRACMGKHVAYLEIKKLVSTFVRNFELELVDDASLDVETYWFAKQSCFRARIRKRM